MNSINIIGRVGADPTSVTFTDTDNKVAKFSVAVNEYSSKSDTPVTTWIDVEAWNNLADRVLKTMVQGRLVGIHGRLAINIYTKDVNGVKVEMRRAVIKLTNFDLLDKKPEAKEGAEVKETATKRRKTAA